MVDDELDSLWMVLPCHLYSRENSLTIGLSVSVSVHLLNKETLDDSMCGES